jgi:hypothetical protein
MTANPEVCFRTIQKSSGRVAEYPPSESDTANTFLIENGNPLTG